MAVLYLLPVALAALLGAWAAWPLEVRARAATGLDPGGLAALEWEVCLRHPWGPRWRRRRRLDWRVLRRHPRPPAGVRPVARADPRLVAHRLAAYLRQGEWGLEIRLTGGDPARLARLAGLCYGGFWAAVAPWLEQRAGTVPGLRVRVAPGPPALTVAARARVHISLAALAWILISERWASRRRGGSRHGTG
ncbi:protein of unknown function [Candidatus Hydrogenisulfobacillus filiaventi]|uniref:DUF2953 domain-containing protein n=1 Tax=Candidatus Hydrogenisulfobacillus filiaventi TaxID=2707344 RepID=A0A6F8ZFC4_9FIRM|nr:protein of unknown function [Candidatus Hydrogenisulfobacillus filiaventi]